MAEIGQMIELTIDDVAFGGDGVGHDVNGEAVFVPFSAVGDRLRVTITEKRRRFSRGEIAEILEAGEGRTEPKCPYFKRCGGCRYQHLTAETEFAMKQQQLRAVLARVGGIEDVPEISCSFQSPVDYGYRNKLRVEPYGDKIDTGRDNFVVLYGYCELDNKTWFEVDSCPLARPELNATLPKAKRGSWGRRNATRKKSRPLTLRIDLTGETYFYFGKAPENIPWLTESLLGRDVRVPLNSFFQINPPVADALAAEVRNWFEERPTRWLIDAYAGMGTFTLALGDLAERIVVIESDPQAVKAAEHNIMQLGMMAQIAEARSEVAVPRVLYRAPSNNTTLVLDPPRSGCTPPVLNAIAKSLPKQIIYVSCNAATLARDLRKLCGEDGYKIERLGIFDMFPRTAHFESAVLLSR